MSNSGKPFSKLSESSCTPASSRCPRRCTSKCGAQIFCSDRSASAEICIQSSTATYRARIHHDSHGQPDVTSNNLSPKNTEKFRPDPADRRWSSQGSARRHRPPAPSAGSSLASHAAEKSTGACQEALASLFVFIRTAGRK